VAMILSPLPQHQRKRKFHLFHGELMEEDDHDEEDVHEEEFDDEVPDEVPDEVAEAEAKQENTEA
jgi:translation initiation factor IF-3